MNKTILIVMSKTGGGHLASAEALQSVFERLYGDTYQVHIIDLLLDYLPWPLNQMPKSYSFMAGRAPWMWERLYQAGQWRPLAKPILKGTARLSTRPLTQVFERYAPDLVISVHPLAQDITLHALRAIQADPPFVIVTTDLATIHPLWFHRKARLCFVASQEAYQIARQAGLTDRQLRLYGLPVRPDFAEEPRPRPVLRGELQMDPNLPAVLLVGGGEGIGKVGRIAPLVARRLWTHQGPQGQVIVVCGRNQRLRARLLEETWPVPTQILGFVDNMPDWMAACDCLVTKAGPGTIAEALIRGLPIILSGYIPGQEEGNIPYVVDNHAGKYSEEPEEIAEIVYEWFGPARQEMAEMAANARALGNPRSTYQIVEEIVKLL